MPPERETLSLETVTYALNQIEKQIGALALEFKEGFDKLERKLDERLSSRDRRMDKLEQDFEDFKQKQFEPLNQRVTTQGVKIGFIIGGIVLFASGLAALFWQVVTRGLS